LDKRSNWGPIYASVTLGGCGIWALVDLILLILNKIPDAEGHPLRRS